MMEYWKVIQLVYYSATKLESLSEIELVTWLAGLMAVRKVVEMEVLWAKKKAALKDCNLVGWWAAEMEHEMAELLVTLMVVLMVEPKGL